MEARPLAVLIVMGLLLALPVDMEVDEDAEGPVITPDEVRLCSSSAAAAAGSTCIIDMSARLLCGDDVQPDQGYDGPVTIGYCLGPIIIHPPL